MPRDGYSYVIGSQSLEKSGELPTWTTLDLDETHKNFQFDLKSKKNSSLKMDTTTKMGISQSHSILEGLVQSVIICETCRHMVHDMVSNIAQLGMEG